MPTVPIQVDQVVFEVMISAKPPILVDQVVFETMALFINPSLSCANPPPGAVNVPYSHQLGLTGGTPPFTYSIVAGNLPAGLSIDSSSGLISGIPTAAGNYVFTAQIVDANGNSSQVQCSILIAGIYITLRGVKRVRTCEPDAKVSEVPDIPHVDRAV